MPQYWQLHVVCYRDFMNLRFQGQAERDAARHQRAELQKSIDGWEGKNIGQSCHEFIMGERLDRLYIFFVGPYT